MSRALALVNSSDESRRTENAGTASPLLETKLYVPRSGSGFVLRSRLIDAIRDGAAHRLTIVVAPAGFGKTTLLAGWLANPVGGESAAGWVSLDPSENEPALFWAYFIKAVRKTHPGVGAQAMTLLQSSRPPAMETVLTTLINEINAIDADFTVILDDYHVIDAVPVHSQLTFLLDHLPRRMRLVIASRSEPPLALPRFRARGELTELRAADLRFTLDEATAFLNKVMALGVSPNDTALLERRTEGWIAGLKLAALSLKGRNDVRGFVDAFSGDNRYIADYLVEEVLQSEPDHIRRFLLGTAILDRMNGALCDAVMGGAGSQAFLEDLERRNLFVVALDDRRQWYRYHHLFADVLQKQSITEDPDAARSFHRRASAWYEEHGSPADAVRHALGAQDPDRAAGLLERAWPEKDRSYESGKWLARVKTLPDAVVRNRPVLSMGYAWGLLNSGELEAAEPRLRDVERWLQTIAEATERPEATAQMAVSDEARFRSLPAELAAARVYLAQALGDPPGSLEHAKRALELVPEGDHERRATGTALLALALWGRGELEAAHRTFAEALAGMRATGHDLDAIRGTFVLGDIRVAQGRLREAANIYERGLQLASDAAYSAAAETDELYLGLSELHREWNDLAAATRQLEAITKSAERAAHKGNKLRWGTAMARVCEARGDLDGALDRLDEAERYERRDPLPRVRPIPAMKARIRIAQGRTDVAMNWVGKAKLAVDDDLSYLREFEHVTLARVLIAQHGAAGDRRFVNDAVRLLERLRSAAETGGRRGSVIEILVLHALAQHALGNLRGALESLTQALTLAEPDGYLRVFMDEGTRMRELLRHAISRGLAGAYTRRVLAALDAPPQPVAPSCGSTVAGLVQPLTTREHEVLRLIAAGLRNQEIAEHLSISAATVKRHIANAYGKLGVGHRTEALARATELKLL
ncbi:MAG TPA: LuxR C-terminal-related transcriptional regulator [Vicinamibacterales bacterium]|nr:LuxR C-terminal-related transcriptional regulator [Vicinamibacterales bacterium]